MICREEKLWVEHWKGLELRRKEAFSPCCCLQALPRLMPLGVAALAGSPSAAGTRSYLQAAFLFLM